MEAEDDTTLGAGLVPAGFERRAMTVTPGSERRTSAEDWAGALVIVERGSIEVVCRGGARRTFGEGSYLCLSWLPVEWLRNPGPVDATVAAYRRLPGGRERVGVPYRA